MRYSLQLFAGMTSNDHIMALFPWDHLHSRGKKAEPTFPFKNKYHIDAYVERIAGKGYTDLIFLVRKNNPTQAFPIIIEFPADVAAIDTWDFSSIVAHLRDTNFSTVCIAYFHIGILDTVLYSLEYIVWKLAISVTLKKKW